MSFRSLVLLVVALATTSGALCAQVPVINTVGPEAAMPGDQIVITGTGLSQVTHVRFRAVVGGFVGVTFRLVVPTSVSNTQVIANVPLINSFTPPFATPAGAPLGSLEVRDAGGTLSNTVDFSYMEATFGQTITAGAGTTTSAGLRAATGYTALGGPPVAGNLNFVLTLDNATPTSPAILAVGAPGVPPYLAVGNGSVIIDIFQPYTILSTPFVTDANGRATFFVPLPTPTSGLIFAVQWAFVDAGTLSAAVANGMVFQL
jgi:hypothetical protein